MKKALAFILALALALPLGGCFYKSEIPYATEPSTEPPIHREKLASIESTVLYDTEEYKITATELKQTGTGARICVTFENNTDLAVTFTANDLIVNDLTVTDGFSISAEPNKVGTGYIDVSYRSMDAACITNLAFIKSVDANIFENAEYKVLAMVPFKIETSLYGKYQQTIPEQGTVLYEKNGLKIAALELRPNTYTTSVRFLVTNVGSEPVTVKAEKVRANEQDIRNAWMFDTIYPGTSRYCEFEIGKLDITAVTLDIDVYSTGDQIALLYQTGTHSIALSE